MSHLPVDLGWFGRLGRFAWPKPAIAARWSLVDAGDATELFAAARPGLRPARVSVRPGANRSDGHHRAWLASSEPDFDAGLTL
jgi:hypothetical protein